MSKYKFIFLPDDHSYTHPGPIAYSDGHFHFSLVGCDQYWFQDKMVLVLVEFLVESFALNSKIGRLKTQLGYPEGKIDSVLL